MILELKGLEAVRRGINAPPVPVDLVQAWRMGEGPSIGGGARLKEPELIIAKRTQTGKFVRLLTTLEPELGAGG